jgi:hypothetical protein
MAKQRQQLEDFDVAEFLRPTDDDLKSALTSLLRDGNSFDSEAVDPIGSTRDRSEPSPPIEVPPPLGVSQLEAPSLPESSFMSSSTAEQAVKLTNTPNLLAEPTQIKNYSRTKPSNSTITPANSLFDISLSLKRARTAYRLNRTELVLYEIFLKWTHAVGETQCEATNRKICEESGLIEKTVRRSLKSLKARGLLSQVKPYDPYTHESAIFDVALPSLNP